MSVTLLYCLFSFDCALGLFREFQQDVYSRHVTAETALTHADAKQVPVSYLLTVLGYQSHK